jgi:hypothetical protein
MVGYEPGYGAVADFIPDTPYATYLQGRLLVMAAVKHGLRSLPSLKVPK